MNTYMSPKQIDDRFETLSELLCHAADIGDTDLAEICEAELACIATEDRPDVPLRWDETLERFGWDDDDQHLVADKSYAARTFY